MLRNVQQRRGWAGFWLLIGLILGGAAAAGAFFYLKQDKVGGGIPGGQRLGQAEELALVPTDAVGFVHIRARDLWKTDLFSMVRDVFEKAGSDAIEAFDNGFAPAPSTMDHVTVVFLLGKSAPPAPVGPIPKQFLPKQPGKEPKFAPPQFPPPVPEENKPLIDFPEHIEVVGIFTYTTDFDETKVRGALIPNAISKEVAGKTYWEDSSRGASIFFPGNKTLVVGTPYGVSQFLAKQKTEGQMEGPLAAPLELAAKGGRHVVAAVSARHFHVNLKQLKNEFRDTTGDIDLTQLAQDAEPLLHTEALAIGVTVMEREDSKVDLHAYYKDESKAAAAEKAIRSLADFAHKKLENPKKELEKKLKENPNPAKPRSIRSMPEAVVSLMGLGAINKVDGYLTNPPLQRNDKELIATFEIPSLSAASLGAAAAAMGMIVPVVSNVASVPNVREAAGGLKSSNNLKQIGVAMLNYYSTYNHFPKSAPANRKAKGQLSWRVHLLPYIEQGQLYKEFKLDEDWDSPTNKKLIERMPVTYQSPLAIAPPGQTYYQVFSGEGAVFGPGKETRLTDITDGTWQTILAVEGGEPVIWTKPDDIPFDPKKPLPDLSLAGRRDINIVMVDGHVLNINLDRVSEKTLKAAITMDAGDQLGPDWEK